MNKLVFTSLIIFICILSSFGQTKDTKQNASEQPIDITEDYNFISEAFIDSSKLVKIIGSKTTSTEIIQKKKKKKYKGWKNEKEALEFANSIFGISISRIKEVIPEVTDDLIQDFNKKNKESHLWEKKFGNSKKYELLSPDQYSKIFNESRKSYYTWKLFQNKYPNSNGLHHFSRVGFSKDKKTALIYVTHSCGSLCASLDYFFFVKKDGKWVEKNKTNVAIS